MASLEDFAPQRTVSLDDFQIQSPLVPVTNKPSNINLAAHTAALSESPESVEATYLRTSEGLAENNPEVMNAIRDRARQVTQVSSQQAMVDILTDPSVSDEQKQAAVNAYADSQSSLYGIRNVVSTEALASPSEDETEESFDARVSFSSVVDEVNSAAREQQIALNKALAEQDPSMVEIGAGFLELLAPYTEQAITGTMLKEIRDGDKSAYLEAFTLLGSTKEEIRNTIKRIPPSERGPVIQKVIDAINQNSSIVFPDENDFVRMDMLRSVLEEGYYGEGDKWIDNLVSVAELVGLPVGGAVRTVKKARNISRVNKASKIAPSSGMSDEALKSAEDAAEAVAMQKQAEREYIARENEGIAAAPDQDLRAAEDAVEARRQDPRQDPVRQAEDFAESQAEARRALMSDDDSLRRLEDEAVHKAYIRSEVKPVSLSQNYRNTNPGKARAAHAAVVADRTEQTAEALYGTSKTEAIAHDNLPEIAMTGGSVKNKVSLPDSVPAKPMPANPRVMDVASRNGAIYLTDAEKAATATRVINDFNHVMGLTTRTEMAVPEVSDIGNQVRIAVTYGPKDNGWASGADALEKVKTSLRSYGVKDEDLTLLERKGDSYVPAKGEAKEDGDYLVKVNYPYTISAGEIENWDDMTVQLNFLDRLPHISNIRQGSITRHLLDPSSLLDDPITLGANRAVDQTSQIQKEILDLSESFTKKFNKLNKKAQIAVENEIKRANFEGKNASTTSLRADGFGDKEIATIQAWREVWDNLYWLENQDMVKSLRNNGYGLLEDSSTDTRLFVKELPRNRAGSHQRAYDPETGTMENFVGEDLTDLYNRGGSIATLRSPMVVNGEQASSIIVRNQPGGSYVRKLRDDDQILNYREGYFTVYYDAPKIIEKTVKDSEGNILKKGAIATAGDIKTAQRYKKRFDKEAEEGVEYTIRDSRERIRSDSEDYWSLQEASGRTAQRVRGERLEDATSPITNEAHNHVLGPVDSMIRSARNTATRVGMRDYLEATKQRAINQYGHMFPKDQYGRPQFPRAAKDIDAAQAFSKEAADARTTVEYINSLERGYINAIDDTIKAGLRMLADLSGERGLSYLERSFNWAADIGGPTRIARGTAFTLYLALNPLRQFIVQSHQAVQLLAIAPKYVTTRLSGDMSAMMMMKMGGPYAKLAAKASGRSQEELREMFNAFERSGLFASVDTQNLVKGSLSDIADATARGGWRRTPLRRAVGLGARGITASRKVGFDLGEEINMLSAWLTHYDRAQKQLGKKKLSISEQDRVVATARSYTYNMNRAGDMPYNENFMGMVFQFMQVPHKAFLQMTTSRHLSAKEKLRVGTFNLAWYGMPPAAVMGSFLEPILPEDGEAREAILQGFEGYAFNKMASLMYGEDVSIDFGSLAATDQTGLLEFVTGLWTTDAGKMFAESPAGSLVAGSNPRITNFAKTAAEYFHFTEPEDGTIATTSEVTKSFLGMASGFSSAFRAKVALEYGKKYSSSGGVTDSSVNTPEAIAALAGFQTIEEARKYWISNELYEGRKSFQEDAKEWYKLVKRELAREGIRSDEKDYALRVLNVAAEQFKDSPAAFDIIHQQLKYDVQNGDLSLYNSMLRGAGEWMDPNVGRAIFNNAPITDEQKELGRRTIQAIDDYREEE